MTPLVIDHVVLRCADIERTQRFYVELLGCVFERRIEALGLVQLRAGASLIDLLPQPPSGRNLEHVCLRVANFDAACARLRAAGVAVGEPARRYGADGHGPSVYFDDPEGNTVELKGEPEPLPEFALRAGESGGQCLCGSVRFAVTLPSRFVAHCHCSYCRRAHGAPFVTWLGVMAGQARIDDPRHRLRWFASSPGAERGFCAACGSPMFFRSERWPGELHLSRALFTTPVDREPQAHVFWNDRVAWLHLGDELPRKP